MLLPAGDVRLAYRVRYLGVAILVAALTVASCGDEGAAQRPTPPLPDPSCAGLFGAPNENTGLSSEECFPRIDGAEPWAPRAWDSASLGELRSWVLENPPDVPAEDPFVTTPNMRPDEDSVCAVIVTGAQQYRIESFDSVGAADRAGGVVTHGMGCGACSSLEDLAVFVQTPDQTEPVRRCALDNLGEPVEQIDECIRNAVGFTRACARIWAYQAVNDARECLSVCVAELDSPYNELNGTLNPCLQCDEDKSGPVFKAVAGRTRRSSGVPAAICRGCETVWRVDHVYE